jgi:hypothetical protein
MGGDNTSQLMVKNVYNVVADKDLVDKSRWLEEKVMEMGLPLKNQVIYLVVAENKILT